MAATEQSLPAIMYAALRIAAINVYLGRTRRGTKINIIYSILHICMRTRDGGKPRVEYSIYVTGCYLIKFFYINI